MEDKKRTKTNINVKIDSELWVQAAGLAAFLKIDKMALIEEALKDRLEKQNRLTSTEF
jgi:hypothetical protein